MISFDQLPTTNPGGGTIAADVYRATVDKAEMRTPKDPSKPDYLALTLKLTNKAGTSSGTIFDNIIESDKPALRYKLGRFVRACGIPLEGAMELKDLAKLVLGKNIVVDVKVGKDQNGNDRAEVDLFGREVYYLPSEFDMVYSLVHPEEAPATQDTSFMNIPDGADESEEVAY